MFKKFALLALATASVVLAQSGLTIFSPPSLVQCQPVLITWSGGTSPYILDVIPGSQTSAPALENLQNGATGTTYSWTVNLAAGTSVTLKITDAKGNIQYTSPLTIQAGSSTSCLNTTATSAAGAAGVTGASTSGAAASGSGASTSGAAGSTSAAGSSSMTSMMMSSAAATSSMSKSSAAASMSASGSASASASSAAATSGAALKNFQAPAGILAVLGAIAALL